MIEFLNELYGMAETGYLYLWTLPDKSTYWFPVERLEDAARTARTLSDSSKNVFYGVGLTAAEKPTGRGSVGDVTQLPGVWFDIDLQSDGAHAEKRLPATVEDATAILAAIPLEPTMIVHSGHGVHAYWLFREMWDLSADIEHARAVNLLLRFQDVLKQSAVSRGWKMDATHDLARVLRLPGTMNHKTDPRPVTVIVSGGPRYNPDDIDQYLPEIAPTSTTKRGTRFRRHPGDGPAADAINGCRFLQYCRDHAATLPEPYWVAMIGNVARCADGVDLVHELSMPYPRYTAAETDAKIRHTLNDMHPQSCSYIQGVLGWDDCPDGGCGVKAPCVIALKKKPPAPEPKPKTKLLTAAQLEEMELPEPTWLVPGIITTGLTLLCGKPKVGKSWLSLQLALSVSYGGRALGKIEVEQRPALYVGLEDTNRRMKSRLALLAAGSKLPRELYLCREMPRANEGGIEKLREIISETGVKLVVIDTFQLFRRSATRKENAYSADYEAAAEIKRMADDLGVSVILVHHLKKQGDSDFVQSVSGSSGITGAADTIAVLDRARLTGDATLKVTGRDIDEKELALRKDRETNGWTLLGSADEVKQSQERQDVLAVLRRNPEGMRPADLARDMEKPRNTMTKILGRMCDAGTVKRVAGGCYVAVMTEEPF